MKILATTAIFLLLQPANGCDSSTPAAPAAAVVQQPVAHCGMSHRFEKTEVYPMNLRADIALDSCTGQLCKTWDWKAAGNTRNAWNEYENRPLCEDLAVSHP